MKTLDDITKEIAEFFQSNGLFGAAYICNGLDYRVIDFAMTPYHAGAIQVQSTYAFQKDYKSMGEPFYSEFRKGFKEAGEKFGCTFNDESNLKSKKTD